MGSKLLFFLLFIIIIGNLILGVILYNNSHPQKRAQITGSTNPTSTLQPKNEFGYNNVQINIYSRMPSLPLVTVHNENIQAQLQTIGFGPENHTFVAIKNGKETKYTNVPIEKINALMEPANQVVALQGTSKLIGTKFPYGIAYDPLLKTVTIYLYLSQNSLTKVNIEQINQYFNQLFFHAIVDLASPGNESAKQALLIQSTKQPFIVTRKAL